MGNSRCEHMIRILSDFFSLFYPAYCLACADALVTGEDLICTRCLADMPKTNQHTVVLNSLKEKLSFRFPVVYAMAWFKFKKGNKVQELLHQLKYKGQREVGFRLGVMIGDELAKSEFSATWNVIVPVPLHPSRRRVRGYNQSEEFAKGLSSQLQIPCSDNFIVRKVKTKTQTKKSKLARWKNVREVFIMKNNTEVIGKHVLLVDDVITTGATLEACASSLLQAGCSSISVVCIAEA